MGRIFYHHRYDLFASGMQKVGIKKAKKIETGKTKKCFSRVKQEDQELAKRLANLKAGVESKLNQGNEIKFPPH